MDKSYDYDYENENDYSWDDGYYGTGPTEPPKQRRGAAALILILVIFLAGIITVLSIMNIRLFRELKLLRQDKDISISFTAEPEEPTHPPEPEEPTQPSQPAEPVRPDSGGMQGILPHTTSPGSRSDSIPEGSLDLQQSPRSTDNIPVESGLSLQEIYTRNIHSVVSISCSGYNSSSTGTGVILSDDGYIVTNAHVVDGAGSINVLLTDNRTFSASLIGSDEVADLAVLYIDTSDLTAATFGDSSQLRVGDTVAAIGDPLGINFRGTYTDGIVSAINRDVDMNGRTMTLIQTNAALNSGNSGGPLINCYGQVIGINTMKIGAFTDSAGVEGIGFAIPSATVKEIVDQLISQGYVSGRPTLGIEGEVLSSFYQHYYRMPAGLYITYVDPNSDAAAKGIENGDLLLSLNGQRVGSMNELKSLVYDMEVGDTVEVVIYRGGEQYRVPLTLSEQGLRTG